MTETLQTPACAPSPPAAVCATSGSAIAAVRLQAALGWHNVIQSNFDRQATASAPLPLAATAVGLLGPDKAEPATCALVLPTDQPLIAGGLLALRAAGQPPRLGFIAKAQRLQAQWAVSLILASPSYRVLKARTTDAMWPDGNRQWSSVIDFEPADLPSGQKALLIKASRTSSLALCMPWSIELDGCRWFRASRPIHKGHLVACTWSSCQ